MFESRKFSCTVNLLDGEKFICEVSRSSLGLSLVDTVCNHLGLDEKEYFGLTYINKKDNKVSWLDLTKTLKKQLGHGELSFAFDVKFFTPSPNFLQHEITRYMFVLQIRQDLLKGRLVCSTPIHALLASYVVQADMGDYDDLDDKADYISGFQFMPDQPELFLEKVKEFHKKHKGLTPSEAEFQYLENARKLPLYGIDMHKAYDADNTAVFIGVSSQGIHIVKQGRQINKFSWPCIMQLSFSGKRFFLDLRVVSKAEAEDIIVVLRFKTRTELKRMYRTAVDHHSFFRRAKPQAPKENSGLFRLGSKFRYSGRRTYCQTRNAVYGHFPTSVKRVGSRRFMENVLGDNMSKSRVPSDANDETKVITNPESPRISQEQEASPTFKEEKTLIKDFGNINVQGCNGS